VEVFNSADFFSERRRGPGCLEKPESWPLRFWRTSDDLLDSGVREQSEEFLGGFFAVKADGAEKALHEI